MEEKRGPIKISLKTSLVLILIFLVIVVTMYLVICSYKQSDQGDINITGNPEINFVPGAIEDFSLQFLKMENNKNNMIYSPLSIKYALNLLNEGANGNTKTQIEQVIRGIKLTQYKNIDNILSLANGIYIRDDYSKYVKSEYINNVKNKYNAEIKFDRFKNATNINKWIEEKTLGKIKNMIRDNTISNKNTKMVLLNALAIDMEWKTPFEGENTIGREFNLINGSKMKATTMQLETSNREISYYESSDITSVKMDLKKYENTELEFIAVMPKENLDNYINKVTIKDIDKILDNSKLASDTDNGLKIYIPKFSFDYKLKLKEDLIKLGIKEAFDLENADFTNMTNDKTGLYVSDALHNANIDFSEKGIKASAATGMIMTVKASIDENSPKIIEINRPFLYLIKDKNTNEVWFVGTVYEPNLWNNKN